MNSLSKHAHSKENHDKSSQGSSRPDSLVIKSAAVKTKDQFRATNSLFKILNMSLDISAHWFLVSLDQ